MRTIFLAILLAAAAPAGQTLATLNAETTLRGTPKPDSAPLGTLAKGASVVVHHEEGDWLAIQAPRGCVSWIGHLFVEFPDKNGASGFPKNAVVRSEGDVKLAVGKAGHPLPLDVRKTSVPDGTIVLVIGPAVKAESDSTKWYPIVPPEDDFRYIPKSAIGGLTAVSNDVFVKSPSSDKVPVPAMLTVGGTPTKANWPNHTLWNQAEAAEQAGDFEKAERLYFQLAKEMNAPGGDGELANLCYSRVHALREKKRQNNSKATSTGIQTVSREETTPRPVKSEIKESTPAGPSQWTGSGYLRVAGFKHAGKQAYALEDSRGRLLFYAVPAGSFELEKYRNKTVDLFGIVSTPKDFRGSSLIEVSKVDLVK